MANISTASIALAIFEHVIEFQLVACKQCRHAVWPGEIEGHLRGRKHKMKRKTAAVIAEYVQQWPGLIQYPSELQVPDVVHRPVAHIQSYRDGLMCQLDPDRCQHIFREIKSIKEHWREAHQQSAAEKRGRPGKVRRTEVEKRMGEYVKKVHCQRFFPSRHGSRYFEVTMGDDEAEAYPNGESAWSQFRNKATTIWSAIEWKTNAVIQKGEVDEVSPWLERTQWNEYLVGLDREELMACVAEPEGSDDEPVEAALWAAMGGLMRYCQESIRSRVGIFVRMEAVRTERHQTRYHPLQPYMHERDLDNHSRAWKQVLMFFARTQKPHGWRSPKYRLNRRQQRALGELIAVAADDDAEAEAGDGDIDAPGLTAVQKACLEFCIALLDQRISRKEYDCALVCALAVLGVDIGGWKGPQLYPPVLSAMIKGARFMLVQQALELDPSESDDSQDEGRPGCLQSVGGMMDRFMIRGSQGPMQWMLDLRTYGLKIHYNTTSMGDVDWVGDQILYKSIQFTMSEFRGMVHGLVAETKRLLVEELLFCIATDDVPAVPWPSLRDNPVDGTPGWSFLRDQRAQWPVNGEEWLFDRIGQDGGRRARFVRVGVEMAANRLGIEAYMARVVEFREKLLVCLHTTGGSPARSPEILSVRHRNTAKGEHRNIFVEDGMVVFVTRYHKGYAIDGDVKIIHRYLPREVGELLIWYLWLVLPFQQRVEAMIWHREVISAHLWPADPNGRRWTSERMRSVMKRESRVGLGQDLTIQSYRDLAIGISRKYLRGNAAFRMDDEDEDGEFNEDEWEAVAAAQAAHTAQVEGMIYARGIMEQSGAVESKRQKFRGSSIRWHQFLGFVSSIGKAAGGRGAKRAVAPFEAEAEEGRMQRWRRLGKADIGEQLRRLYGKEARFRGVQEAAIKAVVAGESPVVAVMATGAGKSLLFMLPAMMEAGGTTIVVVPLIALREDIRRRCQAMGIKCVEWCRRRPADGTTVVLVTPESAVTEGFMTFVNRLKATRQLDRIVVDECHVVLNDRMDFRKQLRQVGKLMAAEVQVVMLTATLPPTAEEKLFERMMVCKEEVKVYRGRTTRRNVKYGVMTVQGKEEERVVDLVKGKLSRMGKGKIVVYCRTVAKVKRLADKIGCEGYYHDAKGKIETLERLIRGETRAVVATGALGMGIDIPDIRATIHADEPDSLMDYGQESGRGGRDGLMSEAIIVIRKGSKGWKGREERIHGEEELMKRYKYGEGSVQECRRVILDGYFDGCAGRVSCMEGEEECDVCGGEFWGPRVEKMEEDQERKRREDDWKEEYKKQQKKSGEGWMRQRMKNQEIGLRLERLERGLAEWKGVCGVCLWLGEDSGHELGRCERGESEMAREWGYRVQREIRFERYAGCWWCGIPQGICSRWELEENGFYRRVARGECGYLGVMVWGIAGILFGVGQEIGLEGRWIRRMEGKGVRVWDEGEGWSGEGWERMIGEFGRRVVVEGSRIEGNGMVEEFCWMLERLEMNG